MAAENTEEQYRTSLLKERVKDKANSEKKEGIKQFGIPKTKEELAQKAVKAGMMAAGVPAPAVEVAYKHKKKLIIALIVLIFLACVIIYLPVAYSWYTYCESGVAVKGFARLFGVKFPCP